MERPISSKALSEVQTAIFKGEKINAIRIYREDTGASLVDAKTAVEKLEAEMRGASPEKFTAAPPRKKGCGVCFALILILSVLAVLLALLLVRHN